VKLALKRTRTYAGLPACPCQQKWCPRFEAELARRGIRIRWAQLIGGGSKSGGTHSTGGANDFYIVAKPAGMTWAEAWWTAIWVSRQMGADASWHRAKNWDYRGGEEHGHQVLTDCPHNGPARYQITDVRRGLNGLARHGRDDGPRPLSGRTWRQGIEWAIKQAKPAAKMRTTDVVIYHQNVASDKGNFTPRAAAIADRVAAAGAHIFTAVELDPERRPILSKALQSDPQHKMTMVSNHKSRVQYLVDNRQGLAKVGASRKWSLGHGKYALAVRYRHRTSGLDFVLVTIHLSYQHEAWRNRRAENEVIGTNLRATWPSLPWAVVGDANDSHKDTKSRPDDTTGDVLEAYGMHDLYYDVLAAAKKRERFNTANQGKTPPPASGIHIDRFFGSASVKGMSWECDVVDSMIGRPDFDHWGVVMTLRITHPEKK
jgi:hypothetical protein